MARGDRIPLRADPAAVEITRRARGGGSMLHEVPPRPQPPAPTFDWRAALKDVARTLVWCALAAAATFLFISLSSR